MNLGIIAGMSAFTLWGFFPVYWKLLERLPATYIFSWRMIMSFLTLTLLLSYKRQLRGALKLFNPRHPSFLWLCLAAVSIGINWFVFIYATVTEQILAASLGYFISPILSLFLGRVFYGDRLVVMQKFSVALVFVSLLYQIAAAGEVPLISLSLALSFAAYGVFKKKAALPSLNSLFFESSAISIMAMLYLSLLAQALSSPPTVIEVTALLGSGIVTILPLILFNIAAKAISISHLGMLNYIAPCLQFICGAFLYQEPIGAKRLLSFALTWIAVLLFLSPQFKRKIVL